jgi:hypothetical protein
MKAAIFGAIGVAAALMVPTSANAQWTVEMTITSAFVEDSDAIVIYTAGGGNNGCVANSWVFAATNEDRRGRAWATALTALSLGKKIKFWFSGGCGSFGFHQATAIQIIS